VIVFPQADCHFPIPELRSRAMMRQKQQIYILLMEGHSWKMPYLKPQYLAKSKLRMERRERTKVGAPIFA